MNRILLSLVPVAAAYTALGQTPGAQPASPADIVSESGKVKWFVAGPCARPQGFLLRNGTFVILPPGLSQQMPATIPANAPISVAGSEFIYDGSRTIQARRVLLAGVTYEDVLPTAPASPPPPPRPRAPRAVTGFTPPAGPDPAVQTSPRPCPAGSVTPPSAPAAPAGSATPPAAPPAR